MQPLSQKLIKRADRIFGKLLVKLISKVRRRRRSYVLDINIHTLKVLIIRPGGLGDAILLTPAIRMMKEKIPSARIHYLGENRNIPGAKLCYGDVVERFFAYDDIKFPLFLFSNIKSYDIVIDTEQSFLLPSVVARIVGKRIFGFGTTEKQKILDESCEYRFFSYEAFEFFRLFTMVVESILGKQGSRNGWEEVKYDDIKKYLKITDSSLDRGDVAEILVAPFTTRGEKMYSKIWKLIEMLKEKFGEQVEIIGDKKLDIKDVAYKVINSKLLISVDNGIMHFRIFSDKPCIVIFGPTNHLKWAPPSAEVIRENLWCSPCSQFAEIPPCPRGKLCMEIPPEKIFDKVVRGI